MIALLLYSLVVMAIIRSASEDFGFEPFIVLVALLWPVAAVMYIVEPNPFKDL